MDYLDQLEQLRQNTSVEEFGRLRRRLSTHLTALEEQQFEYEQLDVPLAHRIVDALNIAIDDAPTLSPEQRGWVRGAIEYFLLTTDAENDVTSPTGLVDDAQVVNYAVTQIGRPDLVIELRVG